MRFRPVRSERRPPLYPARRRLPPPPDRSRQTTSVAAFPKAWTIEIDGNGPEDVVVDASGRLVCGLSGGAIVRFNAATDEQEQIGDTGGRPLGLEALADGRVLICDADRGLLRLDPETGAIEILVDTIDGTKLTFCSNAVAAADGTIWFTQSTDRFSFDHYAGAMLEHRPSGKLFRRDVDGRVSLVLRDLHFANGLTLVADDALIFAETDGYRLSRLSLAGSSAGTVEVIADNLPGFPDNLSSFQNGRFWVAFPSARNAALDRAGTLPGWVRKLVWRFWTKPAAGDNMVWVMAFDASGAMVADLQTTRPDFSAATAVVETDGRLYFASPEHDVLLATDLAVDTAT